MSMFEKIQYDKEIPLKIRILDIEVYPWRYHSDLTIVFVMEGEICLKLSFSHYTLVKGDVHIVHSGDVYGFGKLSSSNKVMLIHVDLTAFKEYFPRIDMELFTTKIAADPSKYREQKLLKRKLLDMATGYSKKQMVTSGMLFRETMDVLGLLHEHFQSFVLNQERRELMYKRSYDEMQTERISAIVSYIYEHYDSKLSLTDIAGYVNLDKYYVSHLFQKYVGENFRRFVSMVRVELSEVRILETDDSISQIAADVGFSNSKYFADNFKMWFGYTPNEYRNNFRCMTIMEHDTDVDEYDVDMFEECAKSYVGNDNGKIESTAMSSDCESDDLLSSHRNKYDLKDGFKETDKIIENLCTLGQVLEIEIMPANSDFKYKLKLDTASIESIRIMSKE